MSRLDEMIAELCPDGVEYKQLEEILKIKNGSDYKGFSSGEIPVYGSGGIMTYIDHFAFDKPSVLIPRKGSIEKLYYVDTPFWNVDTIFYTEIDVQKTIPRYVYHCLLREHLEQYNTAGGVPSLTQKVLNKVKIPVPPLPVQHEIVRILDSFTELTAELTAELAAELTARKKQYEYYVENLVLSCQDSVPMKLMDVCSIYDGTHQTPKYTDIGVKFVSVENIDDIYGTTKYIAEEDYEKYKIKPQIGDVLMTRITAGVIGKCFVLNKNEKLAYYVSLALLRPNQMINSFYLKYYLECGYGKKELRKYILTDATPPKINKDAIGRVKILVPPLDEQNRIVSTIRKFDTLCYDITNSLPAEIAARQKQYEYYRDKLLTFKKLS